MNNAVTPDRLQRLYRAGYVVKPRYWMRPDRHYVIEDVVTCGLVHEGSGGPVSRFGSREEAVAAAERLAFGVEEER
jgi:hypothetical protein